MSRPHPEAQVAELRGQIEALAARFADVAAPAIRESLSHAVERLVVGRAEWFNQLQADSATALRRSVREAIDRGAERVATRLRDPDLWLNPTVSLPHPPQADLDQPNHRVWIAILNAADVLDPVLLEYGLEPADVPQPGGGHYGLQPQSLRDLDRRGVLDRLWRRYVALYERYRDLLRKLPEDRRQEERDEALRRWRQPD